MSHEVLYWARSLERLLACAFGGVSLVLGWNLFRAGVVVEQKAEFHTKSWLAKFEHVGPGVFFALFGAGIIMFSLRSPLEIDSPPPRPPARPTAPAASTTPSLAADQASPGLRIRLLGDERADRLELVRAINTLLKFRRDPSSGESRARQAGVAKALTILEGQRNAIVIEEFGSNRLATYRAHIDEYLADPGRLSREDRETVRALSLWLDETTVVSVVTD